MVETTNEEERKEGESKPKGNGCDKKEGRGLAPRRKSFVKVPDRRALFHSRNQHLLLPLSLCPRYTTVYTTLQVLAIYSVPARFSSSLALVPNQLTKVPWLRGLGTEAEDANKGLEDLRHGVPWSTQESMSDGLIDNLPPFLSTAWQIKAEGTEEVEIAIFVSSVGCLHRKNGGA